MASKPIKVSQLNSYIKRVLQLDPLLSSVYVTGEISNLTYHRTGHIYFSLKDESSRINCFLASSYIHELHFQMTEGMQVIVTGSIGLYERGGSYSINVKEITPDGEGSLSLAYEKLKSELESKGYFRQDYKKSIPKFPSKIAIVTSDTGAALKDMLRIIKMRNNLVNVLIAPCLVQGDKAAKDISDTLKYLNENEPDTDTIILGRGGGSIEELWAFNEEITAKAIFDSNIPVISAVGHETDFTISDYVADKRAQTPTEAASLAVPDINEIREYLNAFKDSIDLEILRLVQSNELRLKSFNTDYLLSQMIQRIDNALFNTDSILRDMDLLIDNIIKDNINTVCNCYETVTSLNPVHLLKKGYAAVTDKNGKFIQSITDIHSNDEICINISDGCANATVSKVWRK